MTQLSALLTPPTVGLYLRFVYVATAGQVSFSGADSNGLTLSYKPGYISVCLNGMVLPSSDYIATDGATIVFGTGLTLGDIVDVTAFSTMTVGDTWSKAQNGLDVTSGFAANAGLISFKDSESLTINQAAQARANIWVTRKNYLLNGAMMISQENGTTAGTANLYYPVDQWYSNWSQDGTQTVAQVVSVTPAGSQNRIRWTVTAADTSIAAGQFAAITTKVEGLRMADLLFGTANAKTVTIKFGVKGPAGTYCVAINNGSFNRSIIGEYTIAAGEANTDVYKTVTFQGDTTGTWATDNTAGLVLFFTLAIGTTFQASANTWAAGNFFGTSNQTNFIGTASNVFELFDVSLTEGSVAPPFQIPDYASELLACQRYFVSIPTSSIFGSGTLRTGGTAGYGQVVVPVPLRTSPTISNTGPLQIISGDTIVNAGALSVSSAVGTMINLNTNIVVSAGSVGQAFMFFQSAGKNSFNVRM